MKVYTEVADLAALAESRPTEKFPLGLPLLLIRKGAEVFVLENRCAHMGCPLAAGTLEGYILTCPCHDWRFDIRGGTFLDAPEIAVRIYPSELRGGKVMVVLT